MKAAHAFRLPFGAGPLPGEAEKRRRDRKLLGGALVLLLAGGAAMAILLLRSPSGPGAGGPTPSGGLLHQYRSPLGWSMRYPNGMYVEHASAGGISYGVDEVTFASFRSRHGVQRRTGPQGETIRPMPPHARRGIFLAGGIAVRVLWLFSLGGFPPQTATPLPLQLSSFRAGGAFRDWYSGTFPRPRQHFLVSQWGKRYFVQVWTGPNASARQRALVARMVASISVMRPRSRP